ncbi:MAG: glycosyltransferase family 2 protein [Chloroflexi bacterium]|nr:glycosyltransferase family 2 protein [Chloroflexota bacterium]
MDLSIIVVSWNTRDLLVKCLESIYSNAPRYTFEVFVVDNDSSDDSVAVVEQSFQDVYLIKNTDNVGFARANNQAIHHCSGRYILLLNSDTEALPDAFDEMIAFLDQHPDAGAAGSYLIGADGRLQNSCYPEYSLFREVWRLLYLDKLKPLALYDMDRWDTEKPHEVDVIQGASLLLRRATLDLTGLLDEDYFMYSEEVDLCHRIKKNGWKLYWVPKSRVIHYGGQSTKLVAEKMFLRLYQSRVLYFRKNYGSLAAFVYKLILLFNSVLRLIFSPLVFLSRSESRKRKIKLITYYRRLILSLNKM